MDDPRIGELVRNPANQLGARNPIAVVVGFPSDRGVEINGGRPGARGGPDAIRQMLYKMAPGSSEMSQVWERIADIGDVQIAGDVAHDQEMLAEILKPYLEAGTVCIILGGGHETAYGNFLGQVRSGRDVSIINIDAHADVRDLVNGKPHSGSSFRQALLHPDHPARSYSVFGLSPHGVSSAHLGFMDAYPGERIWAAESSAGRFDELLKTVDGKLMITFDLDALDQSVAPGVSAPAVAGLDQETWFRVAYSVGICDRVQSIDVSEMNPVYDIGGRTARVAALTVWHFVEGLTTRTNLHSFLHVA